MQAIEMLLAKGQVSCVGTVKRLEEFKKRNGSDGSKKGRMRCATNRLLSSRTVTNKRTGLVLMVGHVTLELSIGQ
jgi:hypothetical protein